MLLLPCALLRMAVFAGFSLSVLAQTGPQLSIGPGRIYTVVSGATAGVVPSPSFSAGVFDNNKATMYLADSRWTVAAKGQVLFDTHVYALNLNTGQARIVIGTNYSTADCTPGTPASCPGDGGPATSAKLKLSQGLALDSAGNLFIADSEQKVIRRVDVNTGIITTIAGTGNFGFGGDGGPATQASFGYPIGIAFDAANNLYIADADNGRIRMISPTGQISTVAGMGTLGFSGDGGPATSAQINPTGVAINSSGNLLIADYSNNVIRQVSGGIITTVAGQGSVARYTGDGGPATAATLSAPTSVATDAGGNIYIADWLNHAIRKVTGDASHTISTIAVTTSSSGYPAHPGYIFTDAQSNVYFGGLDNGGAVSKIASTASLTLSPATGNTGTLTLSNTGNGNLAVPSISSSSSFPLLGGTCSPGGIILLNPGQSCTLSVGYAPSGSTAGTLTITSNTGNQPNTVTNIALSESNGLYFVPITPCRVVDTRVPAAGFGGPAFTAGETRSYNIRYSNTVGCSSVPIPATADVQAYSLNVTAVPQGPLNFLTVYPSASNRPDVSTLNSYDGRIKANAAIVPANTADTNRGISIYADSATHVVVDINGYYVPEASAAATTGGQTPLAFYPVPPCRAVDTRHNLGKPPLMGGAQGSYYILTNTCGLPSTAGAYALNFTVVPINGNPVGYLTTWPSGTTQPSASTLNAPTGAVTANAAIVPVGTDGKISVYSSTDTDLIIDVAGYYAPPTAGGLALYPVAPCRAFDSRNAGSSTLTGGVPASQNLANNGNCSVPATVQSYVLNTTVIPSGGLGYLTAWATGTGQPLQSVLNAYDGQVTSNLAFVPTVDGSISTYATASTHLILDLFGYFAP